MTSPKIQITLRLAEHLDSKLTLLASKMGVSKNAYISMLLSNAVRQEAERTVS